MPLSGATPGELMGDLWRAGQKADRELSLPSPGLALVADVTSAMDNVTWSLECRNLLVWTNTDEINSSILYHDISDYLRPQNILCS